MRRPFLLAAAGSIGVVLASLLPWSRSGEAIRSGFALARLAAGPGFVDRPLARPFLIAWLASPVVAGLAILGVALKSRLLTATAALICSLIGLLAGGAVLASNLGEILGPWTSISAGVAGCAGGGWLAIGGVRLAIGRFTRPEASTPPPEASAGLRSRRENPGQSDEEAEEADLDLPDTTERADP